MSNYVLSSANTTSQSFIFRTVQAVVLLAKAFTSLHDVVDGGESSDSAAARADIALIDVSITSACNDSSGELAIRGQLSRNALSAVCRPMSYSKLFIFGQTEVTISGHLPIRK